MEELRLNKERKIYIFRYDAGDELRLINCLRETSFGSSGFDYFDAVVLAYKVLERQIEKQNEQPDKFSDELANKVAEALNHAMQMEKYRLGKDEKKEQRIDILCNDILPFMHEYLAKTKQIAA